MNISIKHKISYFVVALLITFPYFAHAGPFIAYSMGEAERQLKKSWHYSQGLKEVGGITRIAGMVYDDQHTDLIMVGQVIAGEPQISLDDLVVAIRARLIKGEWPSVSIDKLSNTRQTGKQLVRFGGGIANTSFGKDLFETDVILKKMGLGLIPINVPLAKSYFDMSADFARRGKGLEENISTRFWFYPMSPSLAKREGVFVIKELKIGVVTQVMNAILKGKPAKNLAEVRDKVGDKFATILSENYGVIGSYYPEVSRLKILFDLVGLAEGIRSLKSKPDMTYWLQEYKLPQIETPLDYPLLKREEKIKQAGIVRVMEIDGGIELRALISSLQDGDVSAFKEIVLKSKPKRNPLYWEVPLEGWSIPGTQALPKNAGVCGPPSIGATSGLQTMGCTLDRQVRTLGTSTLEYGQAPTIYAVPPPRFQIYDRLSYEGGVKMNPELQKEGIGGKEEREETLKARPGPKSLSWPVPAPKGEK